MKKITALIMALLCFSLVSCNIQQAYAFINPADEISSISIVEVSLNDSGLVQTEILKIDDIDAFLISFGALKCYRYFGDPVGVTDENMVAIVFKISYNNGDYELINWNGQSEYTADKGLCYYAGYNIFDEEEFKSLISKYL